MLLTLQLLHTKELEQLLELQIFLAKPFRMQSPKHIVSSVVSAVGPISFGCQQKQNKPKNHLRPCHYWYLLYMLNRSGVDFNHFLYDLFAQLNQIICIHHQNNWWQYITTAATHPLHLLFLNATIQFERTYLYVLYDNK